VPEFNRTAKYSNARIETLIFFALLAAFLSDLAVKVLHLLSRKAASREFDNPPPLHVLSNFCPAGPSKTMDFAECSAQPPEVQ
jgi:hypothetical protein